MTWARIKGAPGWLWALAVGLVWAVWHLWQRQQVSARLRVMAQEQRAADAQYNTALLSVGAEADAEREVILRKQALVQAVHDGERVAVQDAADEGQRAFAEHWRAVMGRE